MNRTTKRVSVAILAGLLLVGGVIGMTLAAKHYGGKPVIMEDAGGSLIAANGLQPNDLELTLDTSQAANDSISVIEDFNWLNAGDKPKPPTSFKEGHVTNFKLSARHKKTDYGYEIDLPANNNTPSPSVKGNDLLVSGGFGSKQFFSFDAKSGSVKWAINLDDDGPSSAVAEDSIVVFNTESCTIFAVDQKTGKHLWSYWLGDPLMSTPTIANDMVFTAYPASGKWQSGAHGRAREELAKKGLTPTHVLAAFDLQSGKILWQKWIDGDVMTAPVAMKNELHVVTFPGTYFVFDQKTGKIEEAKRARATSAPVITDDGIYLSMRADEEGESASEALAVLGTKDRKMNGVWGKKKAVYLDATVQNQSAYKESSMSDDAGNGFSGGAPATSGAQAASYNVGASNVSSLQAFNGSRVLNINNDNYTTQGDSIICTDAKDGKVRWAAKIDGDLAKTGGFLGTAPIKAGKWVIVATINGKVKIMDPKNGKVKREYDVKHPIRSQPVCHEGWIYCTSTNGKLIAINTGAESITGWPMLGANSAHTNIN